MDWMDPRCERALAAAQAARSRAYAPYSRFRAGAAVITDRDVLLTGVLVENVSLGLAMCAERAALFQMVAQDAGRAAVLALAAPRTGTDLTLPCGACLQVAVELGGRDVVIVAGDPKGAIEQLRLADLAPRLPCKR